MINGSFGNENRSPIRSSSRFASGLVMLASVWIGLFWTAGRWSWFQGWAFLSFFAVYVGALSIWLARTNPDLYAERTRIADNIEPWDKWVVKLYSLSLLATVFVGALDSGRFGWSTVPPVIQLGGWVGLCLAATMIWHVMAVNNFLSAWVRIQPDRNQFVVTKGAYGWVRHPMYLAVVIAAFCVPLVLASWWALIPGLCVAVLIMYRTAREDRTLIDKLPGYKEYTEAVRYRLLPGIW
ncbi:MAG: methyltransferase family protein [Pirellulaceae bacterium]